jgi:hypothetical protein
MAEPSKQNVRRQAKSALYQEEYERGTRCRQCNRQTNPNTDYNRLNSSTKCRTCIKCRTSVYNCVKKAAVDKPMNLHDRLDAYEKIVKLIPREQLNTIIANLNIRIPGELLNEDDIITDAE